MRWMFSIRLNARPSGYTSSSRQVKSVSFRLDETYSVTVIGPLISTPSLNGSVVYTSTSFRASTGRWSNEPKCTAFPSQHPPPPYVWTGFAGSYAKPSGRSAPGCGVSPNEPSPLSVLAFPSLCRKNVIGLAPGGGQVGDDFHWLSPIT